MRNIGILLVGNFFPLHMGTRSIGDEFSSRLSVRGWKTIETSHQVGRIFRLVDMLSSAIVWRKEYRIACVEVYSGAAFFWAEMVCRLLAVLRKRYILTLHGGNLPNFARRWPGRVKRLLQRAGAVTAPSNYLYEEMRFYREDIILIPNPLDIKNYSFRLRSTTNPRLIWLRAFHNIYNPQMAPLVIAGLRSFYPGITLTMIGPDKGDGAFQETQTIIEKLGLQKNVKIILGIPKSEVPDYLEQSDIFINTTNIDNTPISVLEALACGLCVVSTNVGGIPYLLEDGQNALLTPAKNPRAMIEAIKCVLTEPGLSERLSKNARLKVEQFDWSVILPKWEELLNGSLSHGN